MHDSCQDPGVVERFFATLKYEHLYTGQVTDGDALAVEGAAIHPDLQPRPFHQSLGDDTPLQAYLKPQPPQDLPDS